MKHQMKSTPPLKKDILSVSAQLQKKNSNFAKMNFDPENESFDSSHLKKKRHPPEYSSSSSNFFECSFDGCQKKFYDKTAFHKHQLTHGDKLFICPNCGKNFWTILN